jgi:hypothetical protein
MTVVRVQCALLLLSCLLLLGGTVQAERLVFDFENGPGPLFEIQNTAGLWTIDTDGPTMRISKPEDPLAVNPHGFIVGGIASTFRVVGDFTITVDYELFDFPRDTSNGSTLNESILQVLDGVPQVFEVLRFVSGSSDAQRIEAFGPDAPIGQQNAPSEVLWTGRYRITRVGETVSGAFAPLGSEVFTTLGSAGGYASPVQVFCLGAQGVGRVDRERANTALDIAFDNLIVDGLISFSLHATYSVHADGSGDFPTVQAAVDAAATGDTVLVGPGIYTGTGNRDIAVNGKDIILLSEAGAESTVISVQGSASSPARAFFFTGGVTEAAVVDGFTIRGGYIESAYGAGGGILLDVASPTIRNCAFRDNVASYVGGAIYGYSSGARILVHDCVFDHNSAYFGGAIETVEREVEIEDCIFHDNHAQWGGALALAVVRGVIRRCLLEQNEVGDDQVGGAVSVSASESDVDFESCSFVGNSGGSILVAGSIGPGVVRLRSCTFARNDSRLPPGEGGGTIQVGWENAAPNVSIENTILSFATAGQAVACVTGSPTISCSDIYGNAGGDWVGCIAEQGGINRNFAADPCFCDAANDDFTLWNYSPCTQCGTVGAWPVACWDAQGIVDSNASPAAQQHVLDVSASPNPFSATTSIRFASSTPGAVRAGIFDMAGREVRSLVVDGADRGSPSLTWDGRDDAGLLVPAGVYWVRASQADQETTTRVMVVR